MKTPQINSYSFGNIVIDGEVHKKDVIILPEKVIGGWWRKEGHLLQLADLVEVLEAKPDILVVGMGSIGQMRVSSEVKEAMRSAGIQVISLPTREACREYNQHSQTKNVAAALHLTC
jgi:hypothetical protein